MDPGDGSGSSGIPGITLPVDGWLNDLRDASTGAIIPGYVTSILEAKFSEMPSNIMSSGQYLTHINDLARAYMAPGHRLSGAPLYVLVTNSTHPDINWIGHSGTFSNLTSNAGNLRVNVMHLRVTRRGGDFFLSGNLIGPKADFQSWLRSILRSVEHPFSVSCYPEG